MIKQFNLYELIGLIIGDGCLIYNKNKRRYSLEITGNIEEKEYFKKVANFIKKSTNKSPIIKIRKENKGHSLRLYFHNKKYVEFLIFKIGLTYKNKTFQAQIPKKFTSWKYTKHIIRGLFEADGCLYFSKGKRKLNYYPRIEIKSSSNKIISQLIKSLKSQNFRVKLRKCGDLHTLAINISGFEMVERWKKEIGFGSFRNYSKYLLWKKLNFYIPYITFKERKRLLCGGMLG